jgi:adenylate cyclase
MNASGTPDENEAGRLSRALRAHLRQEFVAPAAAIVGFAEIALDEIDRLGLQDYRGDLERIVNAGFSLQQRLSDALSQTGDPDDLDAYRAQLRHDLRTPINAVKGYGEMIMEDAIDGGHDAIVSDLKKLLDAANGMLTRIDALVAFTGQGIATAPEGTAESLSGASRVIDAIRGVERNGALSDISGRILVVDDNESNRDLVSRRLARDGHAVETAHGGVEALSLLKDREFDLILLDILMPDMSGYEVLGRLKADPVTREIPVIMISALDEMDSIVRCIEAGAVDYMPKPFEPALLRARIRACLENKLLRDRERAMIEEIRKAQERNEALLLSILPKAVVERINDGAAMVADHIPEATILFADLVDFTPFSGNMAAVEVVGFLNRIFSAFDRLADRFGAEKIKTIGDAYMLAVGLPEPRDDHPEAAARMALAMIDALEGLKAETKAPIRLRIGIHTGPAIAGVIGERKFAYDIWGATVNLASRMESHGAPDRIHISKALARRLEGKFILSPRGPIDVKGAGLMETFFLDGERQ